MNKKVLIIGFGGMGKKYYEELKQLNKNFEIYILNQDKESKNYTNYDVNILTSTAESKLLSFDLIIISNPTSNHLISAKQFIDNCKILLIEKPICSNFEEVESFKHKVKESKAKCYISSQRRFHECWKFVKTFIEDNTKILGNLKYISGTINSYVPEWRKNKNFLDLYATRKDLGGGVLLTETHEFDLLMWIIGDITNIVAKSKNMSSYKIPVEDISTILADIKYNDHYASMSLNLDFMNKDKKREISFVFQFASITVNELENLITIHWNNENLTKVIKFDNLDPFRSQLIEIIKSFTYEYESTQLAKVFDGIKVLSVIHAAKESSRLNKICEVKNTIFPDESLDVISKVIIEAKDKFKSDLKSIYGMGSLGYGGYIDGWSDWDIDIILDTDGEEDSLNKYYVGKEIEKQLISNGYDRLDIRVYSVDDLNKRRTPLTFGQVSRAIMLIDSANLIYGEDIRVNINRPSKKEILDESIDLINWLLKKDEQWWQSRPLDDLAAFMTLPARFVTTVDQGEVVGKKEALEYLLTKREDLISPESYLWILWAYCKRLSINLSNVNFDKSELVKAIKKQIKEVLDYLLKEADNIGRTEKSY